MIRLEITPEELNELIAVLEGYLSDLRMEIADTDSTDFKATLRHEKSVLVDLLARLKADVAQPAVAS